MGAYSPGEGDGEGGGITTEVRPGVFRTTKLSAAAKRGNAMAREIAREIKLFEKQGKGKEVKSVTNSPEPIF